MNSNDSRLLNLTKSTSLSKGLLHSSTILKINIHALTSRFYDGQQAMGASAAVEREQLASTQGEGDVQVRPISVIISCTDCRGCSLYSNTLLIPSYVVLVSALALILHISLTSDSSSHFVRRLFGRGAEPSADRTRKAGASLSAGAGGGRVYYAYMVARFVGCLALLGLSIASLVTVIHLGKGRDGAQDPRVGVDGNWVSLWLHIAICMNFVRCSLGCLVFCVTHFQLLSKLRRTHRSWGLCR